VRAEASSDYVPKIILRGEEESKEVPLFIARETKTGDNPIVSVRYDGACYGIPKDEFKDEEYYANNSMHVLSFISLLINKQKTIGESPPPTGATTLLK